MSYDLLGLDNRYAEDHISEVGKAGYTYLVDLQQIKV